VTTAVSRFTRTATLRRTTSSGLDEYGNPELVETDEDVPCHVRPLSTSELPVGVERERWKLYVSPDVELETSDRVVVDGDVFEVVSIPTARYNPRTRLAESVFAEIEAVR
jgi:hypothetical protein